MAMGNINAQPVNTAMRDFIKINYLTTLVKGNTCFKGQSSCINIILTKKGSNLNTQTLVKLV